MNDGNDKLDKVYHTMISINNRLHKLITIIEDSTNRTTKTNLSNDNDKILNTKEALTLLFEDKIAYGEFLSMVRAGKIPAQKAGNKYLFSKKALSQLKTVMFSTNKHGHSIKQA